MASGTGSKHPQEVLTQDVADVAVRVAAGVEGPDELGQRSRVFHGSGQHTDPVEIAAQPDVVDPHHLHRMIDVVYQAVDGGDVEAFGVGAAAPLPPARPAPPPAPGARPPPVRSAPGPP